MDKVSININRHLPLKDPPKFTQIWIFGLKTNHLATLVKTPLGSILTVLPGVIRCCLGLILTLAACCVHTTQCDAKLMPSVNRPLSLLTFHQ
jgi:hypothetical protein